MSFRIIPSWDSSVLALSTGLRNEFESAVNAAISFFEQSFTNNITITIDFGWGEEGEYATPIAPSAVGESSSDGQWESYSELISALEASQTSADDQTAVDTLLSSGVDPTNGGRIWVSNAEAKALGQLPVGFGPDGFVGLNSTVQWTFDPNNRSVANEYDAIGAIEHEISEVMGRVGYLGASGYSTFYGFSSPGEYGPMDLFRYASAGHPGRPDVTSGLGYFSIDGTTLLTKFNDPTFQYPPGDAADWDSAVRGDAFGSAWLGQEGVVTETDLRALDVIGWTRNFPPTISGMLASQSTIDTSSIALFPYVTILDSNAGQTETVTVTLSSTANGTLSNLGSGSYNATTGVYTVAGTATAVTAAVDNLHFVPRTHEVPQGQTVTTDFTISVVNTNGESSSNSTSIIAISSDVPPTISTVGSVAVVERTTIQASSLVTGLNNPSNDLVTAYEFIDFGGGSGYFVVNGTIQPDNKNIEIAATALSSIEYVTGTSPGTDILGVAIYDATTHTYSPGNSPAYNYTTITATTITPPPKTINVGASVITPTFQSVVVPPGRMGPEWQVIGVADLSDSGKADIAWQSTGGQIYVWTMDGSTITNIGYSEGRMGPGWQAVGTGDLNNDGHSDIVWENNGDLAGWLMNGGDLSAFGLSAGHMGPEWHVAGIGDVNGDGKADVIWTSTSGQLAVWEMDGTNLASYGITAGRVGAEWHVVGLGDANGDGRADVFWANNTGQIAVWTMNGTNVTSVTVSDGQDGAEWHAVAVADFDQDGNADVLWESTSGTVSIWFMHGAHVSRVVSIPGQMGAEWHIVGVRDMTGAGTPDIVWENNAGQVALWMLGGVGSVLTGGAYTQNTFAFSDIADVGAEITDFQTGPAGSVLNLHGLLGSVGYSGSNPLADGEVRIVQNGSNLAVQADAHPGTGSYVTIATLDNVSSASMMPANWSF